jgi:formylglycine-generating enzyme required for sulfatase activity
MNNRSEQHPQDETDIIAPVGYQRPEVVEEKAVTLSRAQVLAIAVIIPVLVIVWFLFTAKSVRLEFTPAVDEISISGGLSFELGGVYLLRQGDYQISATAVGYQPLDTTLTINSARNQNFALLLTKLPGIVGIDTDPPGASVNLLDQELGVTPLRDVELPAGGVELFFSKDRYQSQTSIVDIVGMHQPQSISVQLLPDWADVSVTSIPSGAEIFIDDEPTGVTTPGTIEVLTGEHEIRIALPGHRSHRQRILVAAQEQIALEPVTLQQADGLLRITTIPAGAGVTLNGKFEGESPLELAVRSKDRYRLQVFKAGYARVDRSIEVASNEELDISLALQRLTGEVVVIAEPADAQLYVDGQLRGSANQTIRLPPAAHKLEIRRTGYAGYTTEIVPRNGFAQEVKVRLLTIEEARLAALKPVIRTPLNQELVLLQPEDFTMGASRRQPGRRANETLREITMTRLFYLGTSEVSNAQFKAFAQGHDSGSFEEYALNKDDQPVTRVSWESAALYCNWLSQQEGLPLFYRTEQGKVVGSNPAATGYRLPTEAEWAWAARQVEAAQPLRFPWGSTLPPPDRHGNYADRSAAHLVGRIIFGYNDNHIVSAPIGTFAPNLKGIYDLSGNVSEWTTDFYAIPEATPAADPLGPATGDYRVIRGSSWMHGTITELRIPFRDYGVDARQDVGFRLARFAESN